MFTLYLNEHTRTLNCKDSEKLLAAVREYRSAPPERFMIWTDTVRPRSRATRPGLYFACEGKAYLVAKKRLADLEGALGRVVAGEEAEFQVGFRPISSRATEVTELGPDRQRHYPCCDERKGDERHDVE